ncbi:MAG: hypothetical protein CFH00_00022, partial [Alphaproteobacteria bacterium MarineAlpha1_Bin1]
MLTEDQTFDIEDINYLKYGDVPLMLRLYRPLGDGPFPVIVDL